jgi:SAM-dependent methyltransferase
MVDNKTASFGSAAATGEYGDSPDYLYDYSIDLSPTLQRFNLLLRGYDLPVSSDPRTHCELGCGHGVSLNIHAAASVDNYVGVDFNPTLTRTATLLAEASQAHVRVVTASFSDLLSRHDLPMFDTISAQYVWSWIDDPSRAAVIEFVKRHLRPGGSFYVSYQCSPAWDPIRHFRTLLSIIDRCVPDVGDGAKRENAITEFLARFFATTAQSAATLDAMRNFFVWMTKADRHTRAYLYQNKNWKCFSLADVAHMMQSAGLEYIGTGSIGDLVDGHKLTEDARQILASIDSASDRDQLYDMLVNRSFRQDVYLRTPYRLSDEERRAKLLACRVGLIKPLSAATHVPPKMATPSAANVDVDAQLCQALAISEGHVATLAALGTQVVGVIPDEIIEAAIRLVSQGVIVPCGDGVDDERAASQCKRLNTTLCEHALFREDARALVSPLTGSGVSVDRFSQILLHARDKGARSVDEYERVLAAVLAERGERLAKDGVVLGDQEAQEERRAIAENFTQTQLPLLQSLQVAFV